MQICQNLVLAISDFGPSPRPCRSREFSCIPTSMYTSFLLEQAKPSPALFFPAYKSPSTLPHTRHEIREAGLRTWIARRVTAMKWGESNAAMPDQMRRAPLPFPGLHPPLGRLSTG